MLKSGGLKVGRGRSLCDGAMVAFIFKLDMQPHTHDHPQLSVKKAYTLNMSIDDQFQHAEVSYKKCKR